MKLGIDFGTTNSSVARFDGNTLARLTLDPGSDNPHVLPSLIYIDREQRARVGTAAATAYLEHETGRPVVWEKRRIGEIEVVAADLQYVQEVHVMVDSAANGRLLQYVKTALRDPKYHGTQIFERFYTVDELVAILLGTFKSRAEKAFSETSDSVVIGRPVKFSDDEAITQRAQEIIFKAARLVGFKDIRFELEPIGAAYYYHRSAPKRQRAFIFDFGGGTLDLTIAELGGAQAPNIIATHGVLVGGDDLDRRIMQSLRKHFGGDVLLEHIMDFTDNWQTLPMLSRPAMVRIIDDYRGQTMNKRDIDALRTLANKNLGFKLFRQIEQTKKLLSDKFLTEFDFEQDTVSIHDMITRREFEAMIKHEVEVVEQGVQHTLALAKMQPADIEIVLRTGGTSAVPRFASLLEDIFGDEKIAQMDLLTSVVGGLAVVAHEGGGKETPFESRYALDKFPLIGNLQVSTEHAPQVHCLRIGSKAYTDANYTVTRMPVELSGLPAIRIAQADKDAEAQDFLQFYLMRPARVFVASYAGARTFPNWLKSFKEINTPVEVDQFGTIRQFRLFYRDFPKGKVILGGNHAAGAQGNLFMNYLGAVQAKV